MNSNHLTKLNKSPRLFKMLACALLPAIFTSCSEEVITIDLKDAEPKIVIEGTLTDRSEPCTVKISKTGDFYKPSTFPPVTGATVTLLDSESNLETLAENEAGLYRGNSLTGVEGRTYTLTVEAEGKTFDAVSTLMKAVEIDSLTYYFEDDPDIYNHRSYGIGKAIDELMTGFELIGNYLVIKTRPGRARDFHLVLVRQNWKEIIDTQVEDDTVLVICRNEEDSKFLADRLEDYEDMEEGYVLSCYFTYPETEGHYFRIKLTLNGELFQDIFLVEDWYDGGDNVDYDFNYLFEKNNTMKVELLSIDKATHDYFYTLSDVLISDNSGPFFISIPDNPLTNFTNGALGYFAAYSVRSRTIVFE